MEAVIETLTVCCGPGPVLQKRWSYRCPCPLFPRAQSGHSRSAPKDALFTITEPSAAVAVNSRPVRGELTAIYLCEPRKPYPIRHPEQRKDNTKSEYSGSRACPRLGTVRVEVSPAEVAVSGLHNMSEYQPEIRGWTYGMPLSSEKDGQVSLALP